MSPSRRHIRTYEHEEVPYEQLSSVSALRSAVADTDKQIFRFFHGHLKTQQFVGLVQTPEETIEVLPKIHRENDANLGFLVMLLRLTGEAELPEIGTAELREIGGSFLQVWIRHFAESLHRLLKRQFDRQYVEVERETGFIRGRLRVEAMQSGQEKISGQYPCRYEVYTPDHRMNQVLKRCSRLLLGEATGHRSQRLLRSCLDVLDGVSDRPVRAEEIDRVNLNRLNQSYEPLLDLCRLLLRDSTVGVRSGATDQLAVVFNMNRLFESAVATLLRRFQDRLSIGGRPIQSVRVQEGLGKLFGEFSMQVDLSIIDEEGRRTLIDTKYKSLGEGPHGGLSQSDFYQMHAYARAGDRRYDRIILLYPSQEDIRRRFTSGDVTLFVRSIDLRALHDTATGRLNNLSAIEALQEALQL